MNPQAEKRTAAWLDDLARRHLDSLTFTEVRRGIQALSSLYVERRERLAGSIFEGRGKRAAFALFFAPLHFLTVDGIVAGLGLDQSPFRRLLDLGCGTGAAGAAWAVGLAQSPTLHGIERNPWAATEARATYRSLGLSGRILRADLARATWPEVDAVVCAYTLNELPAELRERLLSRMLAPDRRSAALIVEPVSKRVAPWWQAWADRCRAAGGREDSWRMPIELPELQGRLDRAAALDHRLLTARSLWIPARG